MDYEQARATIKNGDLIAWRGRSLVGRVIRHLTGSGYSHVGIAFWLEGRLMVVEALDFKGVVIRPLSSLLPFDVVFVSLADLEQNDPFDWLLNTIGNNYSVLDCFRVLFRLPPKNNNGFQCAELAAKFYRHYFFGKLCPKPGHVVDGCLSYFNGNLQRVY